MPAVPCMKLANDLAGVRAKAASAVTRPPPSATAASSSRSMTPSPHCRMLRFRRWPQLGSAGCCVVEGAGLPCWASGRAACGSPSLLAFSTVCAQSCGLARSGSAGFEGRMGAAGACARMRSICSLKFSPRALRPMTCPPKRESCSIWLARRPSRGLACRLCPGRISGLLKDGINYS